MTVPPSSYGPSPFGPAQTIVQLVHQLSGLGFAQGDLLLLARAHRYVTGLFSGQMRGSGRPFTCHTVGTASTVAQHGGTLAEIAAGMVHAVYDFGDSGAHIASAGKDRRERLAGIIGMEAEAIAYAYFRLGWKRLFAALPEMQTLVEECDAAERSSLFVRLCNEIEQLADLPYSSDATRTRCLARQECCIAMAQSLRRTDLAQLYGDRYRDVVSSGRIFPTIEYPYLIPPASHTKRPSARIREFFYNKCIRFGAGSGAGHLRSGGPRL